MALKVEKSYFLVYQPLEPYFRQLFHVAILRKKLRQIFLISVVLLLSGQNYPVVRYVQYSTLGNELNLWIGLFLLWVG